MRLAAVKVTFKAAGRVRVLIGVEVRVGGGVKVVLIAVASRAYTHTVTLPFRGGAGLCRNSMWDPLLAKAPAPIQPLS